MIDTPAWSASDLPREQVAGFFDFAASITPLGRTGRDEEVARVVAFLASDQSSFVNGASCSSTAVWRRCEGGTMTQDYVSQLIAEDGRIKVLREHLNVIATARMLFPNGLADVPPAQS